MKLFFLTIVGVFFLCGAIFASEEEILTPRKVSLNSDGRKDFGQVSATLEAAPVGKGDRVQAITLTVSGKTLQVPKEQFSDLENPLINTAQFRTEGVEGGQPLLYLTFRLAKQGVKSVADYPTVYIRFQDGKLLNRRVRDPETAKMFDGAWELVNVTAEGAETGGGFRGAVMGIKGDILTETLAGKATGGGTVKFDAAKEPPTIDFTYTSGPGKGTMRRGVWALDGDYLTIALAGAGNPRPAEVGSKPGSGVTLYEYRRKKD